MRKRAKEAKVRKRSKMRASREHRQLELSRSSQLGASEFVSSEAGRPTSLVYIIAFGDEHDVYESKKHK